jgi:peptidoglycan/LPS O-acetylase OafA/YrhL
MDYRAEIDGLRAVAVLSVILFHAGFEAFGGGFVGVDVFFVITGYLMAAIISAELEQRKFSIVSFYERRTRRILPALFLVMLACIPFAWFWLLPSDMKEFSQSLVAISVFASNILFWRERGYFSTAAELRPLLHTWSLAIEEQYYVLFPLFLKLFWRLGKRWILVALGLVFIASLAVAEWGAYTRPDATFYLLPTRCWELLVGAFASFYLSEAGRKNFGKAAGEVGGWLGIVLIVFAIFAYNKATPSPSTYTLAPTLGTALVILFATQQTSVGKFVGNKVFVWIGLISYGAYLWHQPLFAFARYRSLNEPSYTVFLLLSLLSFVLAYFTRKFIELPFRDKNKHDRSQIFIIAISGSAVFIAFGLIGAIGGIDKIRFNSNQLTLINSLDGQNLKYRNCITDVKIDKAFVTPEDFCIIGATTQMPNFILFGDSHAISIANGMDIAAKKTGSSGYLVATSSCPPLYGVNPVRGDNTGALCKSMREQVLRLIKEKNIKKVFLAGRWDYYINRGDTDGNKMNISTLAEVSDVFESDADMLMFGIKNMVDKIQALGASVKVLEQAPSQINDPKKQFFIHEKDPNVNFRSLSVSTLVHKKRREKLDEKFLDLIGYSRLIEIDNLLCDAYVCPIGDEYKSFYVDTNHINDYSAERLSIIFMDELLN